VHEIALKRSLPVVFEVGSGRVIHQSAVSSYVGLQVVRETGPPHMRMFVTRCKVGDLECEGEGNGKKVTSYLLFQVALNWLTNFTAIVSPEILFRKIFICV
jgi:hypothetical protein